MPSVSILVHDVFSPILGLATEIARNLQSHAAVQVVGPDFGHGVCPLYVGEFPYTVVPAGRLYRLPDYCWERRRLERAVTGDIVMAMKAHADTLPVALLARKRRGARVVAYLDEWDAALFHRMTLPDKVRCAIRHLHHPLQELYLPWVEKGIACADEVVSTSTWLQRRFGGRLIPMGVDMNRFRPQDEARVQERKQDLGLAGLHCLVFGGVVRPHKGVDQIAEALAALDRQDVTLVVVGPVTEHLKALCEHPRHGRYVRALGPRPKQAMADYLAIADAVVIPLVDDLLAQSQTPCKVFEAMAMAKPVIASDVSDMAEVLKGCGIVVRPGDVSAMAAQILWVLEHPEQAMQMGLRAQARCAEQYSSEATTKALLGLLDDLRA